MTASEELLSEATVLSRWPALSKSSLRIARHSGRISWVKGKRGSAWYRPSAIETYIIKELEQPCREHERGNYSDLVTIIGSQKNPGAPASTISGMTPELEEHVAKALAQKILKKQK